MALTSWNDILNKPKGIAEVEELALTVEQLSASVLSISEDVGEIALDVSQLSASVLSIASDVDDIKNSNVIFTPEEGFTVYDIMAKKTQNVVIGHISISGSTTASQWVAIGTINKKPLVSYVVPLVNSTDGSYCGMLRLGSSGSVGVYTSTSLTSTSMNASFIYETND